MDDLTIFSIEDLQEMKENALNTYRLIKIQIAGIPQADLPALRRIELDSLEKKIKLYEEAISVRYDIKEFKVREDKSDINYDNEKAYRSGRQNDSARDKKITQRYPVKMFISYAFADEEIKNELLQHLYPLKKSGKLEYWEGRYIKLGDKWEKKIVKELYEADIIMLLVSPNSLSSSYINSIELKITLERCRNGKVIFIPVIITDVYWRNLEISEYMVAPKNGVPIDSEKWGTKNAAYLNIVEQLNEVIDMVISSRET